MIPRQRIAVEIAPFVFEPPDRSVERPVSLVVTPTLSSCRSSSLQIVLVPTSAYLKLSLSEGLSVQGSMVPTLIPTAADPHSADAGKCSAAHLTVHPMSPVAIAATSAG